MDDRFLRVIVGLALECALTNGRESQQLFSLYSNTDIERLKELHDYLISSNDHYDREVAIWLEPVIGLGPLRNNPRGLVTEIRMMEFILSRLYERSREGRGELNNWINFIANAAHSIEDGFWIDAKILLSRALQSSTDPSIERLKADPNLNYEVKILQRATNSYFEEIKSYPLGIKIPVDRLDQILKVQEIMLDMMRVYFREEKDARDYIIEGPIRRMSLTVRYLMDDIKEIETSKRELKLASRYLKTLLGESTDEKRRARIHGYNVRVKDIIGAL